MAKHSVETADPSWRGYIDGLRAVAVISVVMFHLNLAQFSGGFVGVDVFFVISGFLISKAIYKHIEARDKFNILWFYEKRFRRIIPVYVAVTLSVFALGYWLLLPDRFSALARSAAYASGFSANVFFYLSSGYFDDSAKTQPLLHYWSLGVEEQFYVVFPLFILLLYKFAPKSRGVSIAVVAVASLLAAEWQLNRDPSAAFYLLPFRAWELLVGSLLALPRTWLPQKRVVAEVMSIAGLGSIVASIIYFTETMRFPGLTAAVPVLGTAAVILGCERYKTFTCQFLEWRPIRLLGLWSYSIYMVHWPLIIFSEPLFPEATAMARASGVLAASIVLGWASYKFIEQPFRAPKELLSRTGVFAASISSLAALAAIGAAVIHYDGFVSRLPRDVAQLLTYRRYKYQSIYREGKCFMRPEQGWQDLDSVNCLASRDALLWGDSHAADIYHGLNGLLSKRGIKLSQATSSACAPILNLKSSKRPNCKSFNDNVFKWITTNKPRIVIMATTWRSGNLTDALATIAKVRTLGATVILIGNRPNFKTPVSEILAYRALNGDRRTTIAMTANDDKLRNAFTSKGVNYVSLLKKLCHNNSCTVITKSGIPIQWDLNHFTREGQEYVTSLVAGELDAIIDRVQLLVPKSAAPKNSPTGN
ncbi:MAG: acyltransferase [Hyphomicrobiaceae bacterium]|nr:acyltransferase [Hyphomicrobiaceae bacterium]